MKDFKVKNKNENPKSFTITVTEKDGSKSVSKHITADIAKDWDETSPKEVLYEIPESYDFFALERIIDKHREKLNYGISAKHIFGYDFGVSEGDKSVDFKSQIMCTPNVILDENGNEKTIWQNADGSWS